MPRFIKTGQMTVIDGHGETHVFGPGDGGPTATVKIHNPALHNAMFLNPELKTGEAYMDGTLTVEDGGTIRDLLAVFAVNLDNLREQPWRKALKNGLKKIKRLHQMNQSHASRKNVQHHYDLSNDFYRLFLDKDLQYSCAYWDTPGMSLEEAQKAKKRHISTKLNLGPGQRVLDIGCGWGGMAIYIARHFDCEVVGVTLSDEQHAMARERVKRAGLESRVDIRIQDYRHVEGTFDAVVSVGMFEHVGVGHYLEYFSKIRDLLTDGGCALVHSIGRKGGPGTTGKWIRKYIFPGGYSPALSETLTQIEKSKLWITDIEIWRLHYAETLLEWGNRFQVNREKVVEMFDERFARMWEFYLNASETFFRYGRHMNFQIQLARTRDGLPITRDYMIDAERRVIHAEKRAAKLS